MVGAAISESEVSAEAVPGVGVGNSTEERHQSKRWRIAAESGGAVGSKRAGSRGSPHALLRRSGWREAESRCSNVGEFPVRKTRRLG